MALGLVQGLTEFLPVSSSGHLVLGAHLLELTEPQVFFDVLVHVATLVATCLFYRHALWQIAAQGVAGGRSLIGGESLSSTLSSYPYLRLGLMVGLGSVPTAIIGLGFKDVFERMFEDPRFAAGMLLVTALLLLSTRLAGESRQGLGSMALGTALLIGLAQGFAIIPGISRSGTTIACALLLGVEREHAARYSFLLAIPAILGALLLKLGELSGGGGVEWAPMAAGFVVAGATGFFALRVFVPLVNRGALHYFAIYLIPAGALGLVLLP